MLCDMICWRKWEGWALLEGLWRQLDATTRAHALSCTSMVCCQLSPEPFPTTTHMTMTTVLEERKWHQQKVVVWR